MVCTMSESSEDEEFIGQYGGGSFGGSDDDDCDIPIFGFDGGDGSGKPRSKPKDGFEYATPPASDADDDEYDASYAQQTRAALTRLIDQADAALFGDDLLSTGKAASQADPAPPHVAECHEWRSTLGCLRVCGTSLLPPPGDVSSSDVGAQDGHAYDSESDGDDAGERGSNDNGHARAVAPEEHCVLGAALTAQSLELHVTGTTISMASYPRNPRKANPSSSSTANATSHGATVVESHHDYPKGEEEEEEEEEEETLAVHGILSEALATHISRVGVRVGGSSSSSSDGSESDGQRRNRRSEGWLNLSLGLPPRSPRLAIAEGAVSQLVSYCWQQLIVPALSALPRLLARVLLAKNDDGVEPSVPPPSVTIAQVDLAPHATPLQRAPLHQRPRQPGLPPRPHSPSLQPHSPLQPQSPRASQPHIPSPTTSLPVHGGRPLSAGRLLLPSGSLSDLGSDLPPALPPGALPAGCGAAAARTSRGMAPSAYASSAYAPAATIADRPRSRGRVHHPPHAPHSQLQPNRAGAGGGAGMPQQLYAPAPWAGAPLPPIPR